MAYYIDFVNNVLQGVYRVNVTCPFGKVDFWVNGTHVIWHNGIDMTPMARIMAAERALVKNVGYTPTDGNFIVLQHYGNTVTEYKHLANGSITNKVGDIVERHAVIGLMGRTGAVTGTHLHFAIKVNNVAIDPLPYLQGKMKIEGYQEIIMTRPELPMLNVFVPNLNYRDKPNGAKLGALPIGDYAYTGKSQNIGGYEWAEIFYNDVLVYCALNPAWNKVVMPLPKPFHAELDQDGQHLIIDLKPITETK